MRKISLALAIAMCASVNLSADELDDEIQRLEKEKKRLELKQEVENAQHSNKQKEKLQKKVDEAVEKSKKPRDPNDFSHKTGTFAGFGLGYMMGDFDVSKGSTSDAQSLASKYNASGLNINLVAGRTRYFTKMHGLRYYFDFGVGLGGDSYDFSNTYQASGKPWLMFNANGSVDYLIDFVTVEAMNQPWNIGAFAGVSAGIGMLMPYSVYRSNGGYGNLDYGYNYGNSFWGTSYGFQFGLKVVQDKDGASGLEIGYKYRRYGGSAQWEEVFGNTSVNYDGGMIYAMYLYRM